MSTVSAPGAPPWAQSAVRALVLAVMVCCVVVSPVVLVERMVDGWNGTYLVVFCTLVALEGYASFRLTGGGDSGAGGRAWTSLLELVVLFVLLQLCVDADDGHPVVVGLVPQLDWKTAGLFLPVWLTWSVARATAADFARLDAPLSEGPQFTVPARNLTSRFFAGGVILFVAAALTQPIVGDLLKLPHASQRGPVLNVLLFFVLGMVMLGQVQYAALRQRWLHRNMTVAAGLSRRWLRYSLVFVGLIVLVALVLPTSHTGILGNGREVWDQVVVFMRGPLTWLVKLLGKTSQPPRNIHLRPPTVIPPNLHGPPKPHHGKGSGGIGALALGKALIFWLIVAASLVYLLINVLQRRQSGRAGMPGRLLSALRVLGDLWTALLRRLRGYVGALGDMVPVVRVHRPDGTVALPGLRRFARVGVLSPRRQVMHFYLNTVRRAQRRGVGRRSSATPREYEEALASHVPGAEVDVHELTDAFVEARYSPHAIGEPQVEHARGSWQRVISALRRAR